MAKIVIVGDGETAELAYEYFTHDSPHEVVAFSVEREYAKKEQLFGLPVVFFEDLQSLFAPAEHSAFVAISYTKLNRVRARLYQETKSKGYELVSYVSSKAFVWHNVEVGENCFLGVNSTIVNNVKIGRDCWLGPDVTIVRDAPEATFFKPGKGETSSVNTLERFKLNG